MRRKKAILTRPPPAAPQQIHYQTTDSPPVAAEILSASIVPVALALQSAIFNSANFSSIATDANGVIQIFNVGAERMLGYSAADVVNKITPADISDPQEVIARANALSAELGTPITPGFEALSFKAAHGIEDIYELTYIRKDGSRFPAVVSVTALRDAQNGPIGYLLIATDNTERLRAELLQKTMELAVEIAERERLAVIAELSDHAIVTRDIDGAISTWNRAAEKIFGYPRREALGESLTLIIPPDRIDEYHRMLARLGRGESIEHFETVRVAKDGTRIEASVTMAPITGRDGTVTGTTTIARDITARKAAEAAQRASEERFQALAQHSWDAVHLLSAEGVILYESSSVVRVLGYAPEDLVGRNSFELVHPDDVARVGDLFAPLTSTPGLTLTTEVRIRHKDGSWRWMDCVATNLLEHPAVRAIAVNYRDVTERKRTEQELIESAARFRFLNDLSEATRALTDSEQIMKVMTRMLGMYLRASRCAYADVENDGDRFTILHDYTDGCASTAGSYLLALFGPRAVATLSDGQTLIIRNVDTELLLDEGADMFNAIGIKAIITCPLVRNGVLRAMMAVHQATPRDWEPDEIAMVQHVVERCWATIERRTAEERLALLNAKLENRVVERTVELETVNKELEAFSYSVSHDLRAPLRAVDGFSLALLEDFGAQLPEEGQRQLATIRKSTQRMGDLIDDLLRFSRLSRQALKKRPVDTNTLVQAVLEELGSPWPDRQIEIQLGTLPVSFADPALLKQIWMNLLSNALKYSNRSETAVVEIGCATTDAGETFFVRDNGAGFDMRYADKLFGVFQRLHRAEDYEGTGVGLAIVERIVTRHGGRVWADAAVDRGATFSFTLGRETAP